MSWKFAACLALQAFLWACPAFAESSLSWFDQFRYLRFGNEQSVTMKQPVLDLSALKSDAYWYVDGQVWFFPGEFLPLDRFQSEAAWSELQSEKKPILVTINNSFFQDDKNNSVANFGTFAIRVKGNGQRKLSFGTYSVYHPARFFKVDAQSSTEIRSFGTLDPDPARNEALFALCCPINTFEASTDFFLVSHVSSPVTGNVKAPNFSGFFIGPEEYLNQQMRMTFAFHGVIIGCFFLAGVFYAFIFAFRPRDRSSLFLSLFASVAFLAAAQSFFELPVKADHLNKAWTLLNLSGIACLQLFIMEKIGSYLRKRTLKLTYLGLAIGTLAGFLCTLLSLDDLSGLIFIVLMGSSLVLMATVVVLGLRHRIHGTVYFVAGAIVSSIYQYSIIRINLFGLNEDPGNAIALANLAMTFALALVNAKDFAVTYQTSEVLRQDLQILLREVQEKEQARTLFFQNTSHELRTPLNGIIGFMQLLTQNRYGAIPQAAEVQLQKCIRLAISLKNQVNSILDLAKSKKGNLALCNSSISIKELTSEAEDLAAGLLLKRPDFSFQCHGEWQTLLSQFVGDRDKLATILRNLIGNAFKFADPARPNAVSLTLSREGNQLQIVVSDTGIGIPAEHQNKIFEEFQQIAGDSRRAYEGSGLGLAIVRDFVKLMGGEIRVESEPGQGSRFFVSIPEQKEIHLQKSPEMAPTGLTSLSIAPVPTAAKVLPLKLQEKGRLLVVDDNEMNCEVLRDLLEQEGFEVTTVLDGQEALRIMRRDLPDLLLLDMMMPYFSGEDVMKAMQAESLLQDIPVILITARASDDDRLFGLSLGADDYLAKPIHHEELLFRVRNILRRLEAKQKSVEAEEGQKFTQLGRLMQEFSHELKNVFQMDVVRTQEIPLACENILKHMPISNREWQQAARLIAKENYLPTVEVRMSDLPFADSSQNQSKTLRSLRTTLSMLALDPADRLKIWQDILKLSPEQQQECELTLYIVRNFLVMQNQTLYASELVKNILEYSRGGVTGENASTQAVMDAVFRLVRPRLQRLAIRMDWTNQDYLVHINQRQLMQVMLNLVTNASDAIENLSPDDKWIRVTITQTQGSVTISCSNGGPPLTRDLAATMLQDAGSGAEKKGYGLGLGICHRLIKKSHGTLEINTQAQHPEILMVLSAGKPELLKRSG